MEKERKSVDSKITTNSKKIKLFIIYKLLCPYHSMFMKLAAKIKSDRLYSYHRELYEQADFSYGRYEFLNFLK